MEETAQKPTTEQKPTESPMHSTPQGKKKNMMIYIIVAVVLLLGLGGWLLMQNQSEPASTQQQQVYKIGIISPFTGENGGDGELIQRGAEMAKKDFNQEGLTFEFVTKDTLCDPDKAAAATEELATKDKVVAIIGEDCSSATVGAVPVANKYKVVLISPASSSPALSIPNDYFFRTFPSDNLQGVVAAQLMRKNNLGRLAVIYSNEAYGSGLNTAVKQNFEKLGGKVVASVPFERETVNFQTQLQTIKQATPDVLYIVSNSKSSAVAILLEVKKIGLKVTLYGSESIKDQQTIDDAGSIANGMIFTGVTEGTQNFIDKYRATYGAVPTSTTAAQSYDAFMAIAKAVAGGATTGEQIKNALPNITFDGMSGQIKFDQNGDLASGNYNIFLVKDGKFETISK